MFEFVGVLVLLLVKVNEVMCDLLCGVRVHIPADLKGVAGDVTDLDVASNGQLHSYHYGILSLT